MCKGKTLPPRFQVVVAFQTHGAALYRPLAPELALLSDEPVSMILSTHATFVVFLSVGCGITGLPSRLRFHVQIKAAIPPNTASQISVQKNGL